MDLSRIIKFKLFIFLLPFLSAASLRPYSDYSKMSTEERYQDLKLRHMLGNYKNFGVDNTEVNENLRNEIIPLLKILPSSKKKLLELFLIRISISEQKSKTVEKELETFSSETSPLIRSRYNLLKALIANQNRDYAGAEYYFKTSLDNLKGIEKYLPLLEFADSKIEQGQNNEATTYLKMGLEVVKEYKSAAAQLTLTLGQVYRSQGDMALALDHFFKALELYQELGNDEKIVSLLNEIAVTKNGLGKSDDEILYYKKAEKKFSDKVTPGLKANVLGNIFSYYSKKRDYINSEFYYKKSLELSKSFNLIVNIIYLKIRFANEKINRGYYKEAIVILDSLKSHNEVIWDNHDKYDYDFFYARAYLRLNNYKKLEEHFLKAESHLVALNRSDIEAKHYKGGVKLYNIIGDIKKEYAYYKKWQELRGKIEREKSKKLLYTRENESLALNNKLYSQENKNLALKNKQAELILENQKTRLIMLSGFIFAILIIVALQFNRNKIIKRKNLSLEIKERVIREKTNDLQAILDNIVQGVVTIDLIDERTRKLKDISQHFYHIFTNLNQNDFEKGDPISVLFEETSLSTEDLSKINSVIVSSTGESIWQWELNQGNLPMEMTILEGAKIIEIDWVVTLDHDVITKIILTFKDVTEIRGLSEKQKQNEINVKKLVSLSLMDQKEYFILMSSVDKLIQESISVISNNKEYLKENIDLVFRNLHTIKGLARTYDLLLLSAFAHEIEDYFQDVRSQKISYKQDESLEKLKEMNIEIETYSSLAKTKLKWDQEVSTVPLSVKVLTKWYQEISNVNENNKLDVILKEIKNKYSTSLEDALQKIIMSAQKLSKDLGKGDIRFILEGCDIFVTEKMENHLSSIFVHIVRNSIDHGFLETSERVKQNLDSPEINIKVVSEEDSYLIYLSDNGKGIHLETLHNKSIENKIKVDTSDDIEIARLIFESGLSTKDEVSEISGRGVGMDAVRSYLQKLGGTIDILANGESSEGYLPVVFKISVPQFFFEV